MPVSVLMQGNQVERFQARDFSRLIKSIAARVKMKCDEIHDSHQNESKQMKKVYYTISRNY
jgi:hypothetical protein